MPKVVGVSGGPDKVPAIRAALRGGLINVLVTDSVTAGKLLEDDAMDDAASHRELAARVVRTRVSRRCRPGGSSCRLSCPRAVRLLLECRGHVIVSGSGTSHAVALRFAHLLSCCGTPALFLHPGDSQHGAAGALRAEDVWIGLSKGGETTEVCFLAGIARKRGATVDRHHGEAGLHPRAAGRRGPRGPAHRRTSTPTA